MKVQCISFEYHLYTQISHPHSNITSILEKSQLHLDIISTLKISYLKFHCIMSFRSLSIKCEKDSIIAWIVQTQLTLRHNSTLLSDSNTHNHLSTTRLGFTYLCMYNFTIIPVKFHSHTHTLSFSIPTKQVRFINSTLISNSFTFNSLIQLNSPNSCSIPSILLIFISFIHYNQIHPCNLFLIYRFPYKFYFLYCFYLIFN